MVQLIVAGQEVHPRASTDEFYTVDFQRRSDGGVHPVLYYRGKRVITSWSLTIEHTEPQDLHGSSG